MSNLRIGFIGLGIMGKHMVSHLLQAGYSLQVYDINPGALQNAVAAGAKACSSCKEVAESSDVVISMVPDSPDVEKVVLGENGILAAARPGLIYIDMSTISPETARKVATALGEKSVRCLDAPVSGGENGAKNATLSIMVGGDEGLFNEVKPIFEVMGKTITLCGGSGTGQIVKACNQIQVAINIAGMSEAFILAAKAGVDPAIVLKVLSGGYAQSRVMDVRGPKVIRREFEPGFRGRFHFKDLNIILETARQLNVPLPITAVTYQLFNALLADSNGDLDHTAIITVLEKLAGVEVRTSQE
jgi:2-hydroxy-3-oxopropionate reductase